MSTAFVKSTPPPITKHMITRAILSDLAFNAPHLTVSLLDASRNTSIDDLVRAGIVRAVGKTGKGRVAAAGSLILDLTTRGEKLSLAKGWGTTGGWLEIPTGRLISVGPYSVRQHDGEADVSFSWRYEPNDNLAYLLSIGPASSWEQSIYPSCLASNGKIVAVSQQRKIILVPDGFGSWSNLESAVYPVRGCSTKR